MKRFSFGGNLPRKFVAARIAVAAGVALSLVLPLSGCGTGRKLSSPSATASRKIGTISISVKWPERTRLIPLATNSIVVTIKDSAGNLAPGFPKTLVRPADISGTPTVATVSATNLEVGPDKDTNEVYTITAVAYPNADGTGIAQAKGGTTQGLNVEVPDANTNFTLASEISTVTVTIADGSLPGQNLGKDRTRKFLATAKNAAGDVVLTTPGKIRWDTANSAAGGFIKSDSTVGTSVFSYGADNSIVFIATDPGASSVTTTITATETESGVTSLVDATTTITVVPLGLAATEWPRFHGGKTNQGIATAGTGITTLPTAAWTALATPNVVLSSITVGKTGDLYVGAYDENTGKTGKLYAFKSDGSAKWPAYTAKGKIEASPLISKDGTIYFASFDDTSGGGYLYAIRESDGTQVFPPVALPGPVVGTLALDKEGYLYVGTGGGDNKLYKFDSLNGLQVTVTPSTGSPYQWSFSAAGEVVTSLALSDDESAVYFVTDNGVLDAVSTKTAKSLWTSGFATGQAVYASSPMVAGGKVFFGTLEGKLYAVNATDGSQAWVYDTGAQIYTTPTLSTDGTAVYFATFDNVTGVDENKVYALSTATGSSLWATTSFASGFTSSPALSADGGTLYLGCYDGRVYGIDATNGSQRWGYPSVVDPADKENFDSSPAVGPGGVVYIGSYKGKVYALRP